MAGEPEFDPAIDCRQCEEWNAPQTPFRIYGNTYYVGAAGLSAILIDSGDGLILLDGGLPQTAAVIRDNIVELGFSLTDIRFIGLSHAHFDHAGGLAAMQRLSGAEVLTSSAAAAALRSGNLLADDPQFGMGTEHTGFPAVGSVEIIDDGDSIPLGIVDLRAIYTPGHTPGGVTWTWSSCEQDQCVSIVYADSLSAVASDDFQFSANPSGEQLRRSAGIIAAIDCDIFLSPHPFYFNMGKKLEYEGSANPFINNNGCKAYAEVALAQLGRRLAAERSSGAGS